MAAQLDACLVNFLSALPPVTIDRRTCGEIDELLALAVLAFFAFFGKDYYTLQKFVRGLVVAYYFSLGALLLRWPNPIGIAVAGLGFITLFSLGYRTIYYPLTVKLMLLLIVIAVLMTDSLNRVASASIWAWRS